MNRSERVTRASNLYEKLQDVERNLAFIAKNPPSPTVQLRCRLQRPARPDA